MTDEEHAGFTGETLRFLSDLRDNNTREWFREHGDDYEAHVKAPAAAFAGTMAVALEAMSGTAQKPKIFRINRDVRFSKDKTPYNTHVHMAWLPADGGMSPPAFMFGLSPDYCTVGCGVFEFAAPVLEAYRQAIAGSAGDDLGALLGELEAGGCRLSEPALKRLPAGFPADHPWAELALRKGLGAWCDFEGPETATRPGLADRCLERLEKLMPLWRFLHDLG